MSWMRRIVVSVVMATLAWAGVVMATSAKVYVAEEDSNTVSVIDVGTLTRAAVIPVGRHPHNVQVSPNGKLAWVTNDGEPQPEAKVHQKTIETGPGAHGVVVSRDGRHAYVTNMYADSVSVIDMKDLTVVTTIPVGRRPNGISATP